MKAVDAAATWRRDFEPSGTYVREVPQGEMVVSAASGLELTATLGSCISVCLHAPDARIGGMNHIFQTVRERPGGEAVVFAEMERLVNGLMRLGASRSELVARLAGGAHVLAYGRDYGLAIADACLTYLEGESIPVVGVSIGGRRARRVRFQPATGSMLVGLLAPIASCQTPPPADDGNAPEMF
jgi:chemotaxis protein CheD